MARKEGLLGRKVGMTQIFGDDGNQIPVTVLEAGPCTVVGIRTKDSHGYDALQVGFEARKKNVSKPAAGVFRKLNLAPMRVLRCGVKPPIRPLASVESDSVNVFTGKSSTSRRPPLENP